MIIHWLHRLIWLQVFYMLALDGFGHTEAKPSSLQDTISLKEVVITERQQSGKSARHHFSNLTDFAGRRMAFLLNDISAIYVKNYGNGQLSSVAVRGTTAAQTEVMWNGVRINSPMLGQSDLALLNVGFHQAISLQYNQLNSAIGCNLNLQNTTIDSGINYTASLRAGSFGLFETNMNVQYSNGKVGGATKVTLLKANNNFPVRRDENVHLQKNADVIQMALFQQLHFNLSKHQQLNAFLWWNKAGREIPSSNFHQVTSVVQHDESARAMLQWNWKRRNLSMKASSAFLHERLRYIDPQLRLNDLSISNALRNSLNVAYKLKRWTFEGTITADYEKANSSGYNQIHQRGLAGVFAKVSYLSQNGFFAQLGARQELMNNTPSPFMPYLSVSYGKWMGEHNLVAELTAKRSFRFPTMNDLYWRGSGNIHLKPEDSWNAEVSFSYRLAQWGNIAVSNYYTFVRQQIQWVPDAAGRWEPQNLKSVFSRGVELNAGLTVPERLIRNMMIQMNMNYAYTIATQMSSVFSADASIGKQLIYVPRNRVVTTFNVGYRNYVLSSVFRYTGLRFTSSDNENFLPAYYTLDMELSKVFLIKRSNVKFSFRVNNIANVQYEDVAQRAMPGRNFEGTILFILNRGNEQ